MFSLLNSPNAKFNLKKPLVSPGVSTWEVCRGALRTPGTKEPRKPSFQIAPSTPLWWWDLVLIFSFTYDKFLCRWVQLQDFFFFYFWSVCTLCSLSWKVHWTASIKISFQAQALYEQHSAEEEKRSLTPLHCIDFIVWN